MNANETIIRVEGLEKSFGDHIRQVCDLSRSQKSQYSASEGTEQSKHQVGTVGAAIVQQFFPGAGEILGSFLFHRSVAHSNSSFDN